VFERELVQKILEHPYRHEWSLQGFGMLRLYLNEDTRLHIWDPRYAVEEVSEIHDHPWHFTSMVVAGTVVNHRYREIAPEAVNERDSVYPFMRQRILCGVGGGLVPGGPEPVLLRVFQHETWPAGTIYYQQASEIHRSEPRPGTITIIRRKPLEDPDHANVYFPVGSEWVSAEPRPASRDEVKDIVDASLERWFS
jgi:hypothetical protein